MPNAGGGVNRPMTLVDVLQTIYDQANSASQANLTSVPGLGVVAEADETLMSTDTAITYVTIPLGWDQEGWGAIAWD